jgi:hypothetical protein
MGSSSAVAREPTVTGRSTMTGKSGVTNIPTAVREPCVTSKPAATSESAPVKSTIGNAAIPKSTVHVPAIDETTSPITRLGKAATIIGLAKPAIVKTTTVKISGIPSFKERPIVSIVIVIPIVTVPGRIIIISISGEFVIIRHRAGSIGISIRILVHGRRRRIYRPNRNGKTNTRIHVYLRVAFDGNQAGPYDSRKCK